MYDTKFIRYNIEVCIVTMLLLFLASLVGFATGVYHNGLLSIIFVLTSLSMIRYFILRLYWFAFLFGVVLSLFVIIYFHGVMLN